jgi:hypothetical protein
MLRLLCGAGRDNNIAKRRVRAYQAHCDKQGKRRLFQACKNKRAVFVIPDRAAFDRHPKHIAVFIARLARVIVAFSNLCDAAGRQLDCKINR